MGQNRRFWGQNSPYGAILRWLYRGEVGRGRFWGVRGGTGARPTHEARPDTSAAPPPPPTHTITRHHPHEEGGDRPTGRGSEATACHASEREHTLVLVCHANFENQTPTSDDLINLPRFSTIFPQNFHIYATILPNFYISTTFYQTSTRTIILIPNLLIIK